MISNNTGNNGSMCTVRVGSRSLPLYPLVIVCLGLLNTCLMLTAVVIGIYCGKLSEESAPDQITAQVLIIEVKQLQIMLTEASKAQEEFQQALETELRSHQHLKLQLEQNKTIVDGVHRKIEALQVDQATLKSDSSDIRESCGRCLSGWLLFNTSCYFFSFTESSTVKKSWPDSRADCIRRGADLLVIDNLDEQKYVSGTIENMRGSRNNWWENGFWIGLTDTEIEGKWVWINNVTEVEQRYWIDGEPNEFGHLGEDCGVIVYTSDNPWKTRFDANCLKSSKHWICEMTSS
ncbi:CD209 antigen-like isoform X1 [Cottoperca gobio]|uniref:CD209 antigen-like isoform X1 n=1 Tax=Cottoperca gobio TaxID=56716 RepID=A0A6J2S041_COTGO|nr:CD209 antigen-like isoform X1 [Cottoperca gobio]